MNVSSSLSSLLAPNVDARSSPMAIHILASALSFSYDWRSYISWIVAAVCVLWLRIWLGGRKNTWEREWRQRRVIVVVRPLCLLYSNLPSTR